MADLTRFSLTDNAFNVYIACDNLNGVDDYAFKVTIFNFADEVAFELPASRDLKKVKRLCNKVIDKNIVDLTKWIASDVLTYIAIEDVIEGYKKLEAGYEQLEDDTACEDGSEAYGEMLEQQAQEHVGKCEALYGRY